MEDNLYKNEAKVDIGYEIFQIITDYGNPVEIFREAFQNSIDENATEVYCRVFKEKQLGKEDLVIDIWDNGMGLSKENVDCFFGLAKSSKINKDKTPIGKLGYKGHGTKPFFKSESIEIFSKPNKNQPGWGYILKNPMMQLRENGIYKYSDLIEGGKCKTKLPIGIDQGFMVRIRNHFHFNTQHTWYQLNHMYLRDYAKWYTVFGTIKPLFERFEIKPKLFLNGLNIEYFQENFDDISKIDPSPKFANIDNQIFEEIELGHYFPPNRYKESEMKDYATKMGKNKPYYHYYSKNIICKRFVLQNNVPFDFIVSSEGYETKRKYDVLLSATKGTDKILQHLDGERYGLWACKGGVPIKKVDEWIEGGRGVGSYTYMHAFVNCDAFELTGNRGSIENSDTELRDLIMVKINEILSEKKVDDALKERKQIEDMEKTIKSVSEDEKELRTRFETSKKRKHIILSDGTVILEPTKMKTGFSESETFALLMTVLTKYPRLFKFNLLDYNTSEGIDFIVEHIGFPKYIELKGTFQKQINHSLRHIDKFICYDIAVNPGEIVQDDEELKAKLRLNSNDLFESPDDLYHKKIYTSYVLDPESASIGTNIEIIVLNKFLSQILEARIE